MPFSFDQSDISARYGEPKGACQGLSVVWMKMVREGLSDEQKRSTLRDAQPETRQLVASLYSATRTARSRHEAMEAQAVRQARRGVSFRPGGTVSFSAPMPTATPFTPVEAQVLENRIRDICGFTNQGRIREERGASFSKLANEIFDLPPSGTTWRYIGWKSAVGGDHGGHATAAELRPGGMSFFDPNGGEYAFGAADRQGFYAQLLTSLQGIGFDISSGVGSIRFEVFYTIDFTT